MGATVFPAIILAGGQSRRMGEDKTNVRLGGVPLIRHVASRLSGQSSPIAVNAVSHPASVPELAFFPDTLNGYLGPLAGILAAMRFAAQQKMSKSHVLTTAVDTPFIPLDLAHRLTVALGGPKAIAVAHSMDAMHPVCGLWPLTLADELEAFLKSGEKARVKTFLAQHQTAVVDFVPIATAAGPLDPFFNVNTPEDLALAERYLEALS